MSSKNKMLVFGLHSTSDDRSSDLSSKCQLKCKKTEKGSHVIDKLNVHFWIAFNFWWSAEKSEWWASTKMQKNEERPPMSSKNKMLVFGLRSTSDHRPSDLSIECWPKSKKKWKEAPYVIKKEKNLVLDYVQLLIISRVIWVTKGDWNVEKGPLSHRKMKYSFLYYTQLLIIRQVIRVTKVDQNAKKWHVASVRVLCCFSLGLLLFLSGSCVHPTFFCYFSLGLLYVPPPDGKVGIRVAEKFKFFRFMFNKFQPKDNSVQSLLHLLAMQLICDGQWTNWFTLHFYNL